MPNFVAFRRPLQMAALSRDVLAGRGLTRLGARRAVEKAVREVVCRGGSTAPPSPTIGRGKGGAEEPPPPRERRRGRARGGGAMAVAWCRFCGQKKTRKKQKILFRGSAMSSRATKSMPIFATAGIQTPPRPPLESSRSPASIRPAICAIRAAGGYGRPFYGIAKALF